ncbi:MAG: restriction endonuclease subunit S [candidate division WOR-3 bacterium]|nr:restriction endonuclease subunit S [candidate division WOR-3 bacterium]
MTKVTLRDASTCRRSSLKPYPSYKPSGVPWLGDVPAGWDILPGRACYREKCTSNTGMQEKTVLSLSYGRIVVRPPEKLHGLVPASFETYQIVEPGDIVCRPTDLQNDWNSLRFGLSNHRGIITSAYLCFHTDGKLSREFGFQLLHTYDLLKVFYGLGSGLRQNLDWVDFKYLPCLVPSPSEQSAIVRFLDYMDRRIRKYIRAKQKLIALLNEQKQAVIHKAVTRGLDPDVKLKPSGVAWMGDVPQHWTLYRAKLLLRQVASPIPANAEMVTCFRDGQVTLRRNRRVAGFTNAIKELGYQGIKAGQLVLHSMDAFAGAIGVSDSEGKCSPEYVICEPRSADVVVKYYALLLRSLALRGLFVVLCPSVRERAPRVRYSDFGAFYLPRPRWGEQEQIISAIGVECTEIERSLQSARRAVGLVREYRTRLVADVVTGKLDVREAAAGLPQEAEEVEEPELPVDEEPEEDVEDAGGEDTEVAD